MNSGRDQVVKPLPAERFGALVHATVEINDSDCGHLDVQVCHTDQAAAWIRSYISE